MSGCEKAADGNHGQAQIGRGQLWQKYTKGAESYLFWIFPQRSQEGSTGGIPIPGRCSDGVYSPKQFPFPQTARVGRLS